MIFSMLEEHLAKCHGTKTSKSSLDWVKLYIQQFLAFQQCINAWDGPIPSPSISETRSRGYRQTRTWSWMALRRNTFRESILAEKLQFCDRALRGKYSLGGKPEPENQGWKIISRSHQEIYGDTKTNWNTSRPAMARYWWALEKGTY